VFGGGKRTGHIQGNNPAERIATEQQNGNQQELQNKGKNKKNQHQNENSSNPPTDTAPVPRPSPIKTIDRTPKPLVEQARGRGHLTKKPFPSLKLDMIHQLFHYHHLIFKDFPISKFPNGPHERVYIVTFLLG
jgi:hypothetical protein